VSRAVGAWGLSFRRADRGDRSLAWVLALAALSAAALAPFLPWLAPFAPPCPFHAFTGVPCPGCGTTRAALALARGDVAGALGWNPLAALALAAGFAACALAPAWVALRGPLPALAPELPGRARAALVAALAGNWMYLIARGV
jgi:hypothetical protein